ncbi:hypothetical protein [Campylobacter jejuni]|nr:hypothetical protein [Campylobacter jejuni]
MKNKRYPRLFSLQDNLNNQSFNTKENDVNLILNEVFNKVQLSDMDIL